jgi:hypothetical protein
MPWRAVALLVVALLGGGLGFFVVAGRPVARPATDPLAGLAPRLALVQDLATARVSFRAIIKGQTVEGGRLFSNTDEVLIRTTVSGDWGFDLDTLAPERFTLSGDRLTVRLPAPRLLTPGFTDEPAELLDARTTRWLSDAGPGQLDALRAARAQALAEAPQRVTALGIDATVRETTVRAIQQLVPGLLGRPGLAIEVLFDDQPGAIR